MYQSQPGRKLEPSPPFAASFSLLAAASASSSGVSVAQRETALTLPAAGRNEHAVTVAESSDTIKTHL